ncbi:phosphotransferase [Streptacidiphilus rugosus]|uniref:phosphotransferase n=1 Tax=Streptacidiphilus rugosus TaxID=405783 RepID=UPI0007C74993|nr:phosphotransferase [Streptacidiphilus rugosus]
MTNAAVPEELLAVAAAVLPGEDLRRAALEGGGSHHVVLLPGVAVVRVARNPTAVAALPRRTELLRRLAEADLPFAVPVPLTEVVQAEGRTAVALSWLEGRPAGRREGGEPKELAKLLDALREVDCRDLQGLLGAPHEYAGGERWAELMEQQVVPRLPAAWQAEARRRVQDALDLPAVPPSLVHGDLAGANVHWGEDGRLLGVLDWDLAQPFDPAVDAACLSWHGWHQVAAAVDRTTLHRAWTWYRTFGLEQVPFALLNDEPEEVVERRSAAAAAWLERTAAMESPLA